LGDPQRIPKVQKCDSTMESFQRLVRNISLNGYRSERSHILDEGLRYSLDPENTAKAGV
jgi:hypothetical protein